jgi:hypothetical protein
LEERSLHNWLRVAFSEVELHFDDPMQAALPQEKLAIMWDSLWGQAGAFHRIVRAEVTEQQGLCVAIVSCEFEHVPLNAKIVVNAPGRVPGLLFVQAGFHEREVTVVDGQWKLPGTLTLPNGTDHLRRS